ncbi:MAG: hypothetical protein EXS35_16905 [Pedosphaera sp.]|nr:hypothetical protein [Pedosphaera sp.]
MAIAAGAFADQFATGLAPLARAADAATNTATLSPRPFGKGIFGHVYHGGKTLERPEGIAALAANPFIAGTQLSYSWVQLEPKPGEYRWDFIEQAMEPWAKAGKKCWIEVATASKRDTAERDTAERGGRGAPLWIYEQGVPKIQAESTAKYPVYWHPKYLELWGGFIRAFAKKFDGDPRIEFVATGGYSSGHEPNLSAWDNDTLMDQWKQAGFDGMTPTGVYLTKAIMPILTLFGDAFRATPIAQTIHTKREFDQAMNAYASARKYILTSNGMSVKADADSRKKWRERRETLQTKVGYAEWGPTGRNLNLGGKKNRANARFATLLEAYQRVLGDDDDPKLRPSSRLSYLPLGQRKPEVETEAEWNAALAWAHEHLVA